MSGKGILIAVLGFAAAFATYQIHLQQAVTSTSGNFNMEFSRTLLHQSAASGMNFGINQVWDQDLTTGNFNFVLNGCSTAVSISPVGLDTVMVRAVSRGSVFDAGEEHLYHRAKSVQDSITAYFSYNTPISRFFWFSNDEAGVYWITGDTVQGPVHTRGTLRTSGEPVFYGKVTAFQGINPDPASRSNHAHYYGGWEIGVDSSVPTDLAPLRNAAISGNGGAPYNTRSLYNEPIQLEFLADGRAVRQVGAASPDTVRLSEIAPTGVIYSTGDVRVKGVFDGTLTVLTDGNLWIDDDLVYANDPLADPHADDLLGLVAVNNIYVTDNYANNHDCHIQASLMAVNGSFTAQNYSRRPVAGQLRVEGSIVQNRRGAIGTFNWWSQTIRSGFSKRYRFDDRLQRLSPPYYPYVRQLQLLSWWE